MKFIIIFNLIDDSGVSAYMLFYRLCEDSGKKDSVEKKMIPEHLLKIFEEEEIELKKREEVFIYNII